MRGPRETLPPDKQPDPGDHGEPAAVALAPEDAVDDEPVKAEDLLEEYGWMAEEEEYDQQVIEEIEEEDHIEESFHEMWEEEERSWVHFDPNQETNGHSARNGLENGINEVHITGNGHSHSDYSNEDAPE